MTTTLFQKPFIGYSLLNNWQTHCRELHPGRSHKLIWKPHHLMVSSGITAPSPSLDYVVNEVAKLARSEFRSEVSFHRDDKDICLTRAALLVSAEDEAFFSANMERDILALQKEGRETPFTKKPVFSTESLLLDGMSISTWMNRIDALANEVETSFNIKEKMNQPLQILQAVYTVLFDVHRFLKKSSLSSDPKTSYLHLVLSLGCGTAIMLGIIFLEVCRKLGVNMVGAGVGEDFFVWHMVSGKKMVFEPCKDGKIWFQDSSSASSLHLPEGFSLANEGSAEVLTDQLTLLPASNRAILGTLLRNLRRLYWKRASKARAGSALTAPLHAHGRVADDKEVSVGALLRPQDLRLAVTASERLLVLQPHDWMVRRDHGLLLYHSRRYGEAVQELSICMALAPVQEVHVLEPFVEKLHLLRLESSWGSISSPNAPSALA